jgi:hypothetical protein
MVMRAAIAAVATREVLGIIMIGESLLLVISCKSGVNLSVLMFHLLLLPPF